MPTDPILDFLRRIAPPRPQPQPPVMAPRDATALRSPVPGQPTIGPQRQAPYGAPILNESDVAAPLYNAKAAIDRFLAKPGFSAGDAVRNVDELSGFQQAREGFKTGNLGTLGFGLAGLAMNAAPELKGISRIAAQAPERAAEHAAVLKALENANTPEEIERIIAPYYGAAKPPAPAMGNGYEQRTAAIRAAGPAKTEQHAALLKSLENTNDPEQIRQLMDPYFARPGFKPDQLPKRFAVFTAENPGGLAADPATNEARNAKLHQQLLDRGHTVTPVKGRYTDNTTGKTLQENSFLVHDIHEAEARGLAHEHGQNGLITETGYHDLAEGKFYPSKGIAEANDLPYTELPTGQRFALDIDFNNALTAPRAPNNDILTIARGMQQKSGSANLPRVTAVDAEKASHMAKVYEGLPVNDPAAKSSYDALNSEVEQQFKAMQDAGYKVEFVDKDPYKNSTEMMQDLRDNKTLKVLKTPAENFHPYMTPEQNNKFRAVHDWLAHGGEGHTFGPVGEENAYRVHASTLSPTALRALATETRGQNSWVNFGPNAHLPAKDRPFAAQKAALFPEHLLGDYGDMVEPTGKTPAPKTQSPNKPTFQPDSVTMPLTQQLAQKLLSSKLWNGRGFKDGLPLDGGGLEGALYDTDLRRWIVRTAEGRPPEPVASMPREPLGRGSIKVRPDSAIAKGATFLSHQAHTTGFLDGSHTVKYQTPGGKVKVLYSMPEPGKLSIDYIGSAEDDLTNTVHAGHRAVRDIIQDLKERTGATSLTGQRITGVRSSADPFTQTITKSLADSVVTKGAHAALPPQTDLKRYVGAKIDKQKIDDIEEEAYKTFSGPEFEKWLKEGNFADWYNSVRSQGKAVDALGETEGKAAFRDLIEKMAATTARSDPPNNLRRASYYRALGLADLVHPDYLREGLYKDAPKGMGHFAQGAHHKALARVTEEGGINSLINPKPASFDQNLLRNFRPYTNDTRMTAGTALVNPKLVEQGAIERKVTKKGEVSFSPRNWGYAPMERAFQRAAADYAGRGHLALPAGADPTAFAQAKIWDALGPVTGGSRSMGTFDDIFDKKLADAAKRWGVTPTEANKLFWQGHPFDLPLNTDLLPKRLKKGLLDLP